MLNSERYIYVIFMSHLSLEKILKAIVTETTQKIPPKSHNLIYLLKLGNIKLPPESFDFIAKINNASIVTRYPEDLSKILEAYPKSVTEEYFCKTKEILERLAKEDSRVLTDPETTTAVAELADSSVNLVFRPWVKTADYWAVRFDLTENIKNALDEAGISIPYPQQDVHLFVEKEEAAQVM